MLQTIISGVLLILLGILAAPSLLLSKKPNAKEILDKITPYQGWVGVVFAILGVVGLIKCLVNIKLFYFFPVLWLTWLLAQLVTLFLGFILGYGLINKYVLSKNEQASEKGKQMLKKLLPIQYKLGLISIGLGIWVIISGIIWGV